MLHAIQGLLGYATLTDCRQNYYIMQIT